jgi:tetratricopeptide (TPR) repeat protein
MKKTCILIVLVAFVQIGYAQQKPSTLKEYNKVFKTYGFSDPDPIAKMGMIYPYYRFDGYTNKPVDKEWKVVELENDFIKVMILPEIGGKIWGAWEKSTGKPFLYYNQVVKFRDIAMRGAWTSGGIEANYGIIGHTPNCATPVDYLTEKKSDGSVSCYIGTLDLLTQTYWTIEINLPADKGYFTTKSFWYNSTPLEQPYYTWMNTGIKAAGNLEFIYPGNRYIGHNGEYADWKINATNKKDISFYENNNFGSYKSYHVFGKYTDFFGGYWHDDDFGMGRYATHDEKAGKKIWIWGLSQQGMIWDKLLTDTDGQYVEVQSGRLFNQTADLSTFTPFKHRGFAPATADTWTEYWFPVKETKGFVKANDIGALNIRTEGEYLKVDFSPLQTLSEELKISEGTNIIYSKKVNLKTLTTFSDSIKFSGNANNLVVTLGGTKFAYSSNPASDVLNRPVDGPKDFDWNSTYGIYLQAKENIRQRYYPQAEEKLTLCLSKDPNFLRALSDMSMLMYRNGAYQKSLDFALHALRIDTYDPSTNFYYGLANAQLGNSADAKDGFDIASSSVEYRGAAYVELSKIYFKEQNYPRAIQFAGKCLEVNASNIEAHQLLALIHRITNERDRANNSLTSLKQLNPLNHFIRFEEYQANKTADRKDKFTSLIRNEMPQETYLQLADWYWSLGLLKESLDVLSLSPAHPEVYYWMANLKHQLGDKDAIDFIDKANLLSSELVFPFRSRSAEVLTWVVGKSLNWKPKYYLGLIYWSKNNVEVAKELFIKCGTPDFPPFYAVKTELMKEDNVSNLQKAGKLNPTEWRYGKLLINQFISSKDYVSALTTAKEYNKKFPQDFRLSMLLAKTLLLNKQYKACTDLLAKTSILPYEGATEGRQLYREAWLMQAVVNIQSRNYKGALNAIQTSKLWPDNLGVGKPYDEDIDLRLENYMEGLCMEQTKQSDQAIKKWNEVIEAKSNSITINELVKALSFAKLGKQEEGKKVINDWIEKQPESKLAQWAIAAYGDNNLKIDLEGDENFRILKALLIKK